MPLKCDNNNSFVDLIKEAYKIKDEVMLVVSINNEIRVVSRISDDIVALVPYSDDIETVSENIGAVQDAYENARIARQKAKESDDSAVVSRENAKASERSKVVIVGKANEVLQNSKQAHLSALYAGERAEYIDDTVEPILENMELILLSPEYAQESKESAETSKQSAEVSERAKIFVIGEAQGALQSAKSAHLSALYASERAEYIDVQINKEFESRKIEVVGLIDEHKLFIDTSKKDIREIRQLLLRKAQEADIARKEAVEGAVSVNQQAKRVEEQAGFVAEATQIVRSVTNETIKNRELANHSANDAKTAREEVLEAKCEVAEAREEVAEAYGFLKLNGASAIEIKKEMFTTRTGILYETRGEVRRP